MSFNRNVFMWIYRVKKNVLVIHLILQVLSNVNRCIRPLGSIASTGYTKTKHQLSTTNLCEGKVSSYTSLSGVRWFTTSLGWAHRIGKATISKIIKETSNALWETLKEVYLKSPQQVADWKAISKEFENLWNFPHCIGTIDGKHVAIECPKLSGTQYFNYKGFFSVVLLAICAAK